MKRKLFLFFLIIFTSSFAQSKYASIWQEVRKRYEKVNTVQGNFVQNICSESLGTCQEFTGKFYLKRPDRLRLEVTSPDSQIIVVLGKKAWFRFRSEPEVSEQELPGNLSPFDIFSDTLSLAATESSIDDDFIFLRLTSSDSLIMLSELNLWINPKDYTIKKFSFNQEPCTVSKFTLSEVKYNKKISDLIFELPKSRKEN
jgi:chaperone LolA